MSLVRYGLFVQQSRTNITKINYYLIYKAVRCLHLKSWNENVNSIKISKKILDVEYIF